MSHHFQIPLIVLAAASAAALGPACALGDVFLLHQGGQVEGEWLNRDERASPVYAIQTRSGGRVSVAKERVAEIVPQGAEIAEYARLAPQAPDTIEGQWAIAEWCRERSLTPQRETHLRRILELNPDHVKARLALGYLHIGGRWMTQAERLREQGYEFYRGRWRLVQEIELLESRDKHSQAKDEWRGRLTRWRAALATGLHRNAYQQIAEIRDPEAVPALREMLHTEKHRPVRLLYVEVLGKIGTPLAVSVLIRLTTEDRDEEVRYAALEEVARLEPPNAVPSYIATLQNSSNRRVNAAAIALARLGDPSAIEPLIEALVTVHEYAVRFGGPSDAVSTSFAKGSGGGGASFVSGGRTEIIRVPYQNHDVLKALVRLARGPTFGFDQGAWRSWYANEKSRLEHVEARRDDGK